jgi:hypothetical protein
MRPEHFATFVGTKVEEIWFFAKEHERIFFRRFSLRQPINQLIQIVVN